MTTLSEQWLKFSGFIFRKKPTASRLDESRKAFFAGALTMFKLAAESESADAKLALYEEAKKVCEEIKPSGRHLHSQYPLTRPDAPERL